MNLDLTTLASFGFSYYNDELNDCDLQGMAEITSSNESQHLPTGISISFVDLTAGDEDVEQTCETSDTPVEPMEITSANSFASSEPTSAGLQELLLVVEQYNAQHSRPVSPASSESSEASSTRSTESPTLEVESSESSSSNITSSSNPKRKRGRRVSILRDDTPGEFHCDKCKRNFRSSRGLRQHINSHHTGIKAHGCDICGKRFDLLEDMKKHRERHSEENKPFKCRAVGCTKRFMHEFDMERHEAVRHGKAPHCCEICGKGFGRKDHLEKHEDSHKFNRVKVVKSIE